MSDKFEDTPEIANVSVTLSISGKPVQLEIGVPTKPIKPARMLPLLRSMSESFVGLAVENARAAGLEVSCKKGCGACCRQMVPIAEFEARQLREVVAEMPEPVREKILKRFEEAQQRLREAGLLEDLLEPEKITKEKYRAFALKYFHQGIACPFLEEESCSIHPDRPLVCREYLVVSPAEHCRRVTEEPIKVLKIPIEMSNAASCFNEKQGSEWDGWVPLIRALDWADAHPDDSPERPGTELLRELFQNLTGRKIPDYKF